MNYVNGFLNGVLFGLGIFVANILVEALFHRHLLS